MDGNKGCTFMMIGIFALILGIAWLHDQTNQRPPASDAAFESKMTKQRVDRRQRCIDNSKYIPKDFQKNAAEIIQQCASDD